MRPGDRRLLEKRLRSKRRARERYIEEVIGILSAKLADAELVAEVTGRLGETLGGIRVVKAYTVEKREQIVFARGAHRLFRNVAKTVTGVSAGSTIRLSKRCW